MVHALIVGEEINMKTLITYLSLLFACITAHGAEQNFEDILARVTQRDPITKAILHVDNHRMFRLDIEGDKARVIIWKNMKVKDLNEETHVFPLSDIARQEYARIQFQEEMNKLLARCTESEQRFRVSQYKSHPIRYGMPYEEAEKVLKDEFVSDGVLRAEAGAYCLNSDTHSIIFRHGALIDIVKKKDLQQDAP